MRITGTVPLTSAEQFAEMLADMRREIAELQRAVSSGPTWKSYTPTLTGWTLGNGTLTGGYQELGDIVVFAAELTVGSTTTKAGDPQISLPFPVPSSYSSANFRSSVVATLYDASGGSFTAPCYQFGAQGCRPMLLTNIGTPTAGSPVGNGTMGPTSPFTFTNPDNISVSGWYRLR